MSQSARLVVAGIAAGSVWYGIALAFDKGVRDFNYPVIPFDSWSEGLVSWLAAVFAGTVVAVAFQKPMLRRSRVVLFALPILTLPIALTIFSALIWLARVVLGSNEGALQLYGFAQIWGIFFLYGLVSVFAPIVYILAVATQWTIRRVVI